MSFDKAELKEGSSSVEVEIMEERDDQLIEINPSFSQPEEQSQRNSSVRSGADNSSTVEAPEKKLTIFAFRLAILEKSASLVGTLAFIWATVVLLGGFAITLERKDFIYVTIILLTEGTRTFGRSRELEWQHRSTLNKEDSPRNSFRLLQLNFSSILQATKAIFWPFSLSKRGDNLNRNGSEAVTPSQQRISKHAAGRIWHSTDVQLLPRAGLLFVLKNISRILILLQILSAVSCIILSLLRLFEQDYGEVQAESKNRALALNLFYGMAVGAALMFLMEKLYWTWKFTVRKLLEKVNKECKLGPSGIEPIRRFYYDAYKKCIDGSVFDGLKMDLVTFAKDLLSSESLQEQFMGAHILHTFVTDKNFDSDTRRKLGTSTSVIEKLIEILNWRNPAQEKIRELAAGIVTKLAGKRQHAIRVAGIPGAMESISSLLHSGNNNGLNHSEVQEGAAAVHEADYEITNLNMLGLSILKKLAYDQDNCAKIVMTRNLLPRIITFTRTTPNLLRNDIPESHIKAVHKSLEVIKLLVRATGSTGTLLRQQISEIVFTVSNIREIIQSGERHITLRKPAIEILASLAMDEIGKEKIGSTGRVIKVLLSIFFEVVKENENMLTKETGEAMTMLTQGSENNCHQILKEAVVLDKLISALNQPLHQIYASRILRNLCAYSKSEYFQHLKIIKRTMPTVLQAIMTSEEKLLEPSIGLTIEICKFMDPDEFAEALSQANIKEAQLVEKLVQTLKQYPYPNTKVPGIRRFVVELAMCMMQSNKIYVRLFKNLEMEKLLEDLADSTSELESFQDFSGSVGLSRHRTSFSSIIKTTLELVHEN